MFKASIIGNLGSDAKVQDYQGNKFVSFDVAETKKYKKADGTDVEETTWVSCTLNGDGGNLLQYLKKGKKVYVDGDCSVRVYSSKVKRAIVAGVNLAVRNIELIGGITEDVPKQICDDQGRLIETFKAYYIDPNIAKEYGATKQNDVLFGAPSGGLFRVNVLGYVKKEAETPQSNETAGNQATAGENSEGSN